MNVTWSFHLFCSLIGSDVSHTGPRSLVTAKYFMLWSLSFYLESRGRVRVTSIAWSIRGCTHLTKRTVCGSSA